MGVPLPLAPSGGGNHFHDDGGCGGDGDGRDDYLDLTVLKRRLHHQYLHDALARYCYCAKDTCCNETGLLHISTFLSETQTNGSNDGEHRRRHVGGGVVEALNNPIELSERVYSDSYEIIIDYWSMWGVV